MKFRDLEVGQAFTRTADGALCYKEGPGKYSYVVDSQRREIYVSVRERRIVEVIPEGEPPSSIEAAKRDAPYHLLINMAVNRDELMALRDREGIGIFEGQRRLKQAYLLAGIDVLQMHVKNEPEQMAEIVHDMLTMMREIVQ